MYFDLMAKSLAESGQTVTEVQYGQFLRYGELLKEWNEKINLTAITDDEGIMTKHFLDSLTVFQFPPIREAKTLIDVGTGAGFPGLPLKIIQPELELTLLDSLNKRLNFLKEVGSELKLTHIDYVHARAEDGSRNPLYRDKFDIAVSRAVANLTLLAELCLPYVRKGGYFIALKGPAVEEELMQAEKTISLLGGNVEQVMEVAVAGTDLKHNLVIVKKLQETPKRFPRTSAAIKKPL